MYDILCICVGLCGISVQWPVLSSSFEVHVQHIHGKMRWMAIISVACPSYSVLFQGLVQHIILEFEILGLWDMCYGPIEMNVFYFCMGKWFCRCMSDFKFKAMVLVFSSKVSRLLDFSFMASRFVALLWDIVGLSDRFQAIGKHFEVFSVTFSTWFS